MKKQLFYMVLLSVFCSLGYAEEQPLHAAGDAQAIATCTAEADEDEMSGEDRDLYIQECVDELQLDSADEAGY